MVDKRAIKRYNARRLRRLRERGFRIDADWEEEKHPRDEGGKFTSGSGSGVNVKKNKVEKIDVAGPAASKAYIKGYIKKHPDIEKEIPKYKGVLDRVRNFEKDNPGIEDGTYDAVTGKPKDISDGFCVTFHQNLAADDPYGGYDDDDYAALCAIAAKELGADGPNIGYFGNAEVSFNCKDKKAARAFAIAHNQHSVYDVAEDSIWVNPYYDKVKNPIEGK